MNNGLWIWRCTIVRVRVLQFMALFLAIFHEPIFAHLTREVVDAAVARKLKWLWTMPCIKEWGRASRYFVTARILIDSFGDAIWMCSRCLHANFVLLSTRWAWWIRKKSSRTILLIMCSRLKMPCLCFMKSHYATLTLIYIIYIYNMYNS